DPHLAIPFDPDLRRAEHVAGRMQADVDLADPSDLAVGKAVDLGSRQADPRDGYSFLGHEITTAPKASVIRVGVGDHRRLDGLPRIDVEPALGAEEARRGAHKQVVRRLGLVGS
ncbi:MAG: hypothetical protein RJA16_675, partial [Planctomycetota bacterium]